MHPAFLARGTITDATPIWFVSDATWPQLRRSLPAASIAYADAAGFEPKPGRHALLPAPTGGLRALFGIEAEDAAYQDRFLAGRLPDILPEGAYRFANSPPDPRLAALAFALGSYRFARYRGTSEKPVRLELPEGVDGDDLSRIADAVTLA